jgi:MFS transporter, SP family, general alpha glucoside:H+ symporter
MNVVMVFYNLAAGGIGPIVAAETSSIRLRAKTNSVGFFASSLMSWAFTFFVPYMFNVGNADWGGKTAFFFTGLSFIAALVIFLEIPEMKNRTYVELDEMFEKHIPSRRFKEYARETD